jgi:beta-lactamase class A
MKYFPLKQYYFFFSISLFPAIVFSQTDSLREKIAAISASAQGTVGVCLLSIEHGDTLTFNGTDHLPMQSVFKFPLALAVLHAVDKGKLSLDQKIHLSSTDLLPNTWSPLKEKYPGGNVEIPLRDVLYYTVSQSDNNGCDVLFRLMGGPKNVDRYIKDLGIENISIAATEEEMHREWNVQYTNWCTPLAMGQLFKLFFADSILSKESRKFLWKILTETSTGTHRIKGLLPADAVVGHKTGSSGTNEKGVTAASNDAGIVTLPNGNHIVLVVFVSNSTAKDSTRDTVIAQISKVVWDYYSEQK